MTRGRKHASAMAVGAALAVMCAGAAARAQNEPAAKPKRARGRVVAVTATEVFVDFGKARGLRAGDELIVNTGRSRARLEIVDVGSHTARAALPPDAPLPHVGDRASAPTHDAPGPPRPAVRRARPPDRAETIAARWNGVDRGRPARIAYRDGDGGGGGTGVAGDAARGVRGKLALDYGGIYDLRELAARYHRVQVRSDLDLSSEVLGWFDYSHRVRFRLDLEPGAPLRFQDSRDTVLVYRLRAGFGGDRLRAEIGRTEAGAFPGASLVDGATVSYRVLRHVYVGAFGGASPDILDLLPAVDALRFGGYTAFRWAGRGRDPLRIGIDVGFAATSFDGELDRRALGARLRASGEHAWLNAQTVVDFYPADHPSHRPATEPTSIAVDAGTRWGRTLRASLGFDHFRAVRTREALAALPTGYLSTVAFTSARGSVAVDLGHGIDVDAHAGYRWPAEGADTLWGGGTLRVGSLALADDRAWIGGEGFVGVYQDGGSGYVGYGIPLHARIELDARYRFTNYRYGDENQRLQRHAVGLDVDVWLWRGATFQLRTDADFGDEARVLTAFASTAFRF